MRVDVTCREVSGRLILREKLLYLNVVSWSASRVSGWWSFWRVLGRSQSSQSSQRTRGPHRTRRYPHRLTLQTRHVLLRGKKRLLLGKSEKNIALLSLLLLCLSTQDRAGKESCRGDSRNSRKETLEAVVVVVLVLVVVGALLLVVVVVVTAANAVEKGETSRVRRSSFNCYRTFQSLRPSEWRTLYPRDSYHRTCDCVHSQLLSPWLRHYGVCFPLAVELVVRSSFL